MKASAVGIADVVCATEGLGARGAAVEAIVRMCGLALAHDFVSGLSASALAEADLDGAPEPPEEESPEVPSESIPRSVRRLQPVRQGSPTPSPTADPIAGLLNVDPRSPSRFEGLLSGRDAAELLCHAASVLIPTDRVDLERAIEDLSLARPVTAIRRVHVPSLALGAQVLVDVSQSMQPFLADQEDLLGRLGASLREVAGVRYVADDPTRAAGSSRRRSGWSCYRPPRLGTPVIALSDLGCGFPRRPQATRAWLGLARWLRRRQSRLVVFAPVRVARIPVRIRRTVEVVLWDRSAGRRAAARLRRSLDA